MLPEIFSLRSARTILIKCKSSWVWISGLFPAAIAGWTLLCVALQLRSMRANSEKGICTCPETKRTFHSTCQRACAAQHELSTEPVQLVWYKEWSVSDTTLLSMISCEILFYSSRSPGLPSFIHLAQCSLALEYASVMYHLKTSQKCMSALQGKQETNQ